MELYRDLIEKPEQRKFQFLLGVIFSGIAIGWLVVTFFIKEKITFFDGLYSILLFANGVFHIIEGRGKSITRLFGKAYVVINEESIKIKPSILKKEQRFFWSEIKGMKIRLYEAEIMDENDTFHLLKYGDVDYPVLKEVKETLRKMGTAKNIDVNSSIHALKLT